MAKKEDMEYLGNLDNDELVHLAETLDVEFPENYSEDDYGKIKELVYKKIEELGRTTQEVVDEFLLAPEAEETPKEEPVKKGRKKNKDILKEQTVDLSKLTFSGLSKKNAKDLEKTADRRAMKLIRVSISCNNPDKHNYEGEIFTVQNGHMQEVKKFVQYNTPTHIPQIIYNVLKDRKTRIITKQRVNGRQMTKSKLIDEYNITILPPLTGKELDAIRQKQLADPIEMMKHRS